MYTRHDQFEIDYFEVYCCRLTLKRIRVVKEGVRRTCTAGGSQTRASRPLPWRIIAGGGG